MDTVFDAPVDPGQVERSLAASAPGSVWLTAHSPTTRPQYPALTLPVTCDLVVVGGGYTGLWTALHAARRNPNQRIVLIEANRIGWAASGRNGGFVEASLTHGTANGKARWPNEIHTLEAMGRDNLDGMEAEIRQLGLDAEWQRTGMLTVATEPHQVDWLRQAAADGQGQFLGRAQVQAKVRSPTYLGGCSAPTPVRWCTPPSWCSDSPRRAGTPACESTSTPTPRSWIPVASVFGCTARPR